MQTADGKSQLSESRASCPACGAVAHQSRGQKLGYDVFSCATCGTLFVGAASRPTIAHDYDTYYHEGGTAVPDFVHRRLREIVAGFSGYRQENRLLDLGCGSGVLMQAAAEDGWQVSGLDVSQSAAEHVRSLGFEVYCGVLPEAVYPDQHFDVVAASELLEHVLDPRAIVGEVARILRRGGLFWATTPHGKGLSARLLREGWSAVCPPDHLQLFSRRGMNLLLTEAGFSRVRIAAYGVDPVEIVRGLRGNRTRALAAGAPPEQGFDQVDSRYNLNEALLRNRAGVFAKYCANGLLNLWRLGDSLKIQAVR